MALNRLPWIGASLFISGTGASLLILLVYVDDILVTGPDIRLITRLISNLNTTFALKDLGNAHFFLGVEMSRTSATLYLTESKYITDLLLKTHMEGAKPFRSPASSFS